MRILLIALAALSMACPVVAEEPSGGGGGSLPRMDAFGAVPGRLETEQKAQILASVLEYRIAILERKVDGLQKQVNVLHAKLKAGK